MAVDYAALAVTANTLVSENGAACSFKQLNSTPADASEPWRGAANPATGETSVEGFAVRVQPSSASRLGLTTEKDGFVKRSDAILIAVAPSSINDFDELVFDGVRYSIEGVEELNPAGTNLVYFVGIRR